MIESTATSYVDQKIVRTSNFNKEDVEFTGNTGATLTTSAVKTLGIVPKVSDEYLCVADGSKLKVAGVVRVHSKATHTAVVSNAYALKGSKKNILGMPDISGLKLVTMSNAKSLSNDNCRNTLPVVDNDNVLANDTVDVVVE